MKHITLILLFMIVGGSAIAQSTSVSSLGTLQGTYGKEVLVSNDGSTQVIYHRSSNDPNLHEFTIFSSLTQLGAPNTLVCNLGDFLYGIPSRFSVLDMQLFDGYCYFCGSMYMVPDQTPYVTSPIHHKGFIGRFPIADVLDGGQCPVYLAYMERTDTVSRLTVFNEYPQQCDVFIVAVGSALSEFDGYYHTYLIELQHLLNPAGSNWEWNYNQMKLSAMPPEEVLTDVIVTRSYIEVVSRLSCGANSPSETKYRYRIHQAKKDGFYKQYVQTASTEAAYEYNSQPMGCHHCCSEPLLLSPMADDYFCLAYGSQFGTGTGGNVVSYMNSASYMVDNGCFMADVDSHVKGVACMPQNSIVAVLSQSSSHPNGVVQFHPWLGGINNSQLSSQSHLLQSVDSYQSGSVTLGGGTATNDSIFHFTQNGNYTSSDNTVSCLPDEDDSYIQFDPLYPEIKDCSWLLYWKLHGLIWSKAFFPTAYKEYTPYCNKYQNQQ